MAKHAIWRDVSKTSATGLYLPEHRLKTPNGDAVLKLANSAVFNADDPAQYIFHLRCSSVGIINESTGERDIEKAKKAAENMLRKRMRDTIAAYQEDLEALDNVISRERKATEPPEEPKQTLSPAPSTQAPLAAPTPKKRTKTKPENTSAKKSPTKKTALATDDKPESAAKADDGKKTRKRRGRIVDDNADKASEKADTGTNTKPVAKRRGRRTEAG